MLIIVQIKFTPPDLFFKFLSSILGTGVNRALNFYFWFVCKEELVHGCPSSIPMYFVVGALAMQTLLLCDFMFFYLKAVVRKASNGNIQLPNIGGEDSMLLHLDV